ncbi:MAG: hypothetical protein KJ043_15645, partial [Anaerolineae bacterium]|nr:hypothetical protein [Anaerolineae bacterium]
EFPEGGDNAIFVWDVQRGEVLHRLEGHTEQVREVAYHPDGDIIVSVSSDDNLFFWDAQTGELINTFRQDDILSMTGVAYSPDGATIATSHSRFYGDSFPDLMVRIRDAETGAILHTFEHHSFNVVFSPDGRYLLSGGDGMRIWDTETGAQLAEFNGSWVHNVAFSLDGDSFAYTLEGGIIQIYRTDDIALADDLQPTRVIETHSDSINDIVYHPNGRYIVSSETIPHSQVRLWDIQTGAFITTVDRFSSITNSASLNHDSTRLIFAEDWRIHQLDTASITSLQPMRNEDTLIMLPPEVFYQSPAWTTYSPDGQLIMAEQKDNTIVIWDVQQPSQSLTTIIRENDQLRRATFSPNSRWISAIDGDVMRMWDARTGDVIHTFDSDRQRVSTFAYRHDSAQIAFTARREGVSSSYNITIFIYDLDTFTEVERLTISDLPEPLIIVGTPDNQFVAWGWNEDFTTTLWSIPDGEKLFTLNDVQLLDLAFSPSGEVIMMRASNEIRLYHATTGDVLHVLGGHSDTVFPRWSDDGRYIISTSNDGTIRIWGVPIE